ncbi:sensor histidine kinase [Actinomadura rudentiformis]|uniref:histidine kinase n=1 Tax=Actinomadura rudentiformis TaxID=359158 RepID=A0A6H9Z2R6_9ACTN|nr:sensor histidine kinase [Actinomadura rudentiformis]KAB2347487.1 sensor histidine kinase [Actinomadura rudentiformis]
MKRLRLGRDAVWAGATAVAMVLGTLAIPRSDGRDQALDLTGVALLVLPALAIAVRRRFPLVVALIGTSTTTAYYALDYPGVFSPTPAIIGIYALVTAGARLSALAVGAVLTVAIYVVEAVREAGTNEGFLWMVGWVVAMVVMGESARNRRAYLEAVEQRAAEAERTREEAALRRAGEERLWIAQELHDTLTHSISVINVQAGMAVHLADRDPARSREALTAIKEAGQDAMRELRRTLGVLRQVDADGAAPGLDRLPRLVDRARAAGLTMTYEVRGEPRPLPAEADRAAYRILQEALTNVLRHAGHVPVTLTTDFGPDTVTLAVVNDRGANAPATSGTGMGVIGMRERAMAVGGSLQAEPGPGGGFRVRAELPL